MVIYFGSLSSYNTCFSDMPFKITVNGELPQNRKQILMRAGYIVQGATQNIKVIFYNDL